MDLIARLAVLATGLLVAGAAQADCKPLVDAVNKTVQQSRFGVYEVQNPEQALGAEPDVVMIGTVSYVRSGKEWERIEAGGLGGHWARLRKELAGGELNCKTTGTGRYRGTVVTKFTVTRAKAAEEPNYIFIDQRSGLPVYEGTNDGGFAVVYGDAVKEPKVKK
jgi:hypothetical protein